MNPPTAKKTPKDSLGDRMKAYEAQTENRLMPLLPTFARVDGRSFSSFTRGMARPFDSPMSYCMRYTAMRLAQHTNATMVYTQSDEITLMWYSADIRSQIWFDLRHSKMVSQAAAQVTMFFIEAVDLLMPQYRPRRPTFDARVWQVPNKAEAVNAFLWREKDATKNSITMAARTVYSDKELHGLNGYEKQAMLLEKDINWNDYPASFKRGSYIQRRILNTPFTAAELDDLPPRHHARTNPDLVVERSQWLELDMPPLSKVINRQEVFFEGAEPVVATE